MTPAALHAYIQSDLIGDAFMVGFAIVILGLAIGLARSWWS